ncbi:unnamed protein product [Rodentolepis nana]|uniref:RanBP2-type domain-containing protein n=1 Tax=Rodentolepis nana TaxID=102285 RepID=A0A158QHX9_RODNA|nr:unnamed protein product [Rodentolepis nana]
MRSVSSSSPNNRAAATAAAAGKASVYFLPIYPPPAPFSSFFYTLLTVDSAPLLFCRHYLCSQPVQDNFFNLMWAREEQKFAKMGMGFNKDRLLPGVPSIGVAFCHLFHLIPSFFPRPGEKERELTDCLPVSRSLLPLLRDISSSPPPLCAFFSPMGIILVRISLHFLPPNPQPPTPLTLPVFCYDPQYGRALCLDCGSNDSSMYPTPLTHRQTSYCGESDGGLFGARGGPIASMYSSNGVGDYYHQQIQAHTANSRQQVHPDSSVAPSYSQQGGDGERRAGCDLMRRRRCVRCGGCPQMWRRGCGDGVRWGLEKLAAGSSQQSLCPYPAYTFMLPGINTALGLLSYNEHEVLLVVLQRRLYHNGQMQNVRPNARRDVVSMCSSLHSYGGGQLDLSVSTGNRSFQHQQSQQAAANSPYGADSGQSRFTYEEQPEQPVYYNVNPRSSGGNSVSAAGLPPPLGVYEQNYRNCYQNNPASMTAAAVAAAYNYHYQQQQQNQIHQQQESESSYDHHHRNAQQHPSYDYVHNRYTF